MFNIKDIIVSSDSSIVEALEIIDKNAKQIALVVNSDNKFLGTISDGDVRRALLDNKSLNTPIENLYNKNSITANINDSKESIINICVSQKIHQIPIIDNDNNIIKLEILDELISSEKKSNKVVLMVGGLGTRLRPLTDNIPKPMLKVGNKPILETIINRFKKYGYVDIIMCVNYKSNIIQDYFGDGNKFGVKIEYIFEDKKMGTAGALSLLKEKPNEPFFVMNGDILTNINFDHMMDFHLKYNSIATMCVREYDFQVPYGVIEVENGQITSIKEKPVHNFFVNAGIYVLNSACLEFIPGSEFYDMTSLFDNLININKNVTSFPLREYWLDIGIMKEYEKANIEYNHIFD